MSLFRISLAILALGTTYIGYEEARVAWHCPKRETFHTGELRQLALREGPVWADIQSVAAIAPRLAPRTIDHDRYVPVRCDEDRCGSPLVLIVRPAHADKIVEDEEGYLRAEGLVYLPSPSLEEKVRKRLEASGVDVAPGFRVLEVGRSPSPRSAAAALLAGGLILVGLAFARRGRKTKILVDRSEVRAGMATREDDEKTARDNTAIASVRAASTLFSERRRPSKKEKTSPLEDIEILETAADVPRDDDSTHISEAEIASILDQVFGRGHEQDDVKLTDTATGEAADVVAAFDVDSDRPAPDADPVAVGSAHDLERPVVSRDARRRSRFQEFDSILTFARPRASGEVTKRRAPFLRDAAPHALEPDDDVLAILETCELLTPPGLWQIEGDAENEHDATPIDEIRLLSEAPRSRREPAKPA